MITIDGFKETRLGLIPIDWEMVPLGEVFEPVNVKLKNIDIEERDIPVLSMTRTEGLILQSEKFEKRVASRDTSNYKVVKKGQLVYGFPIDEGVIAIQYRYPIGAVSPAYHVWQPKRELNLTFIDYMLKTPAMVNLFSMYSSNVVERRRNLAPKDFILIEVPLPPLPEQRAIAHVLSTVRQSIEATERVIAAARELKRSLMKHLFTYGPVPVDEADQVVLKETEIGEVPEGWEIKTLGELCSFTTGKLDSNRAIQGGRYPFFTCSRDTLQIDTYSFNQEAILLAGNNAQGKYSVKHYKGKFDAYQRTYVISVLDEELLDYRYLLYELSRNLNELQNRSLGTVTKFLTSKIIRSLKLNIPPQKTQKEMARLLDFVDKKIESEENRKVILEILFESLLYKLMKGKVRVSSD